MKIKREHIIIIISTALAILVIALLVNTLSSHNAKEWLTKPLSSLNAGDILLLVIAHALLNKSEYKSTDNSKTDKP